VERRFEQLVTKVSAILIGAGDEDIDQAIESVLSQIGESLGVQRVIVWEIRKGEEGEEFHLLNSWTAPGFAVPPRVLKQADFPWAARRVRRGESVQFSDLGELPEEAATDRRSWETLGARSHLTIPLRVSKETMGALSLGVLREQQDWSRVPMDRLQMVVDSVASALARKAVRQELRLSEGLLASTMDSFHDQIAVIDRQGTILRVNRAWQEWVRPPAPLPEVISGVGLDYLGACRDAAAAGDASAARTLAGIEEVLQGERPVFEMEYPCEGPTGSRWFRLHVVPLQTAEGGLVISYTDVTKRREMEVSLRQLREQTVHLSRALAMGEIAGALAHELNQPLTAILSNAQAARRFLEKETPEMGELSEILADIIADERRAAEVIRRNRSLLKKVAAEPEGLSVTELVAEALALIHDEALFRGVEVEFHPAGDLPPVRVDRVQIQQVLLNLVMNGLEAMQDVSGARLLVQASLSGPATVEVSVRDGGTGLGDRSVEDLFLPFFSTKSDGLGLGLSISRSIVEAHDGRLWATQNDDRGLTLHFTVPVAPARG
jgi:signal transduction histidine kinase